jgi:integrase
MRKTAFTDKHVARLPIRAKRYAHADPEQRGHYIRVQPSGAKSYVVVASNPHGKQVWATLANVETLPIADAREKARTALRRISEGLTAFEAPADAPELFPAVAERWLKRHVQVNGLRSEREIRRLLDAHVLPRWKRKAFLAIRRGDVTALLDEIEDDHSARQADSVLAVVRGICNWYQSRHDDYTSPVVRGMKRYDARARARERTLTDDELRAVWKAAEAADSFGALVLLLLLTGQRRAKVAAMRWDDVADGVWMIQGEAREKGNAGELKLPQIALDIITAQPRIVGNPHVLGGRGAGHLRGYSLGKRALDAMLPNLPRWTLHDLRRTARSLMSRAGVRPDIAERVLGHAIGGVEGIYDRHRYDVEKADALARLATLIEGIVHPRENVVSLDAATRHRG